MSYYDPEVYNYDALRQEDKNIVDYFRQVRANVIDNMKAEINSEMKSCSILENIKGEIALQVLNEVEQRFEIEEMESIVATIDGYEERK